MKKYIYTTLILTLGFLSAFSQTGGVKGTVSNGTDSKPVNGATVSLLKQSDSSVIAKTVSGNDGSYFFGNLAADSVILQIEALNFQPFVSFFNVYDTVKNVAPVKLELQNKDLSTVTIVAKTPAVALKADTAQFAASQYKVNPDATTEDLIKKMPGITVAKDGTVTAQGETVKKVTIDGKDFFGDDASAALKNLPAEVIDKIQVFDRLSDQAQLTGFDDGNSVKAINVVTKSGIKNGRFGRVYAGYGTDDRYSAGGNASFFKNNRRLSIVGNFNNINLQNFASQDLLGVTSSGGGGNRGGGGRFGGGGGDFNVGQSAGISRTNAFGLNYSNQYGKKVTLTGSYFFNNSRNVNESVTSTQTFKPAQQTIKETSNGITENTNHRINLRLEYKIDSSNTLIFIPSINLQKNNSVTQGYTQIFNNDSTKGNLNDLLNSTASDINSDRTGYNIRNSILFRHAFAKKGRSLSLGFNVNFTKNDNDKISDLERYTYTNNILTSTDPLNQLFDNTSNGHTIGGTIAYTEPVGKKSQLQFDYNPSIQKNSADQQTYRFDGTKYSIPDYPYFNQFDNSITTNNGGVTYRYSPNKDEMFSVGVSYQNSLLESERIFPQVSSIKQNFSAVLPNLMWRKKLSNFSNIRVFYRASTNFPSVNQLQDVVTQSSSVRATIGNPALKQSYTQFISGRYSYTNSKTSRSFFANFFYQAASDYITNAIYIPTGNAADSLIQPSTGITLPKGAQLTKPVNLSGYNTVRGFLTYAMPLKFIKSNLNLNAGYSYSRLPGMTNNVRTITNNSVYNAGAVLGSNISEYVDFNVSYTANWNFANGSSVSNSRYLNQAAGVTLNLLDKKGWFVQNDVSYQVNSGLADGLNQKYALWNAALGKKFLKNKVGELKLSVFDLLKQNQSITRTVDGTSIIDAQTNVLQRYFMLTFTYNLKNFGTAKQTNRNTNNTDNRPMMPMGSQGGPGGGGPGGF